MPLVLDADAVRAAVPMAGAIDAVREAFIDLADGLFVQPQRLAFGESSTLVMSAYHEPTRWTAVKTLSVEAGRDPMILGTLVWSTALGQLVVDAEAVTALRTGAVSGVATDLLAPEDASRLALLGTGAQAADQVRAVVAVRPIRELVVHGRRQDRAQALLDSLLSEFPLLTGRVADTAEDAVSGVDIVCCATSSPTPLFRADALPERVHVNAIGSFRTSMRELPEGLMTTSCVVVDQVEAALAESGEVNHAVENGLIELEDVRELGHALQIPPVTHGRTVFKSVGLAIQDWAIASLLGAATGLNPDIEEQ